MQNELMIRPGCSYMNPELLKILGKDIMLPSNLQTKLRPMQWSSPPSGIFKHLEGCAFKFLHNHCIGLNFDHFIINLWALKDICQQKGPVGGNKEGERKKIQ